MTAKISLKFCEDSCKLFGRIQLLVARSAEHKAALYNESRGKEASCGSSTTVLDVS